MRDNPKGTEFAADMSFCNSCKYNKGFKCDAFDDIPYKFMFEEKHTKVIKGQLKPVVYTPVA